MTACNSCGGVIGRDCFNPQECADITRQMAYESARAEMIIGLDCRSCDGWSGKFCMRVAKCEEGSLYIGRPPIQAWITTYTPNVKLRGAL